MKTALLLVFFASVFINGRSESSGILVRIATDHGNVVISLDAERAPLTVANFLRYVDAGHYNGGRFHRTVRIEPDNQVGTPIKIAVLQADVAPDFSSKDAAPIALEPTRSTGLAHRNGTISMVRLGTDTATSGFFICIGDQPELDFGGRRNADGQGFAAFGSVIEGMDLIRRIHAAPATGQKLNSPVKIKRIERLRDGAKN